MAGENVSQNLSKNPEPQEKLVFGNDPAPELINWRYPSRRKGNTGVA